MEQLGITYCGFMGLVSFWSHHFGVHWKNSLAPGVGLLYHAIGVLHHEDTMLDICNRQLANVELDSSVSMFLYIG